MRSSPPGVLALIALLGLTGCPDDKPSGPPRSRIDAVQGPTKGSSTFCEKEFPASGPNARRYVAPPLRPLPAGARGLANDANGGWTWVNLWATWCEPCRDEMPLLGRWKDTLAREGTPIRLELLTVDAPENGPALVQAINRGLPGPVTWLRDEEAMAPFLQNMLGVKADDALPIHALVDPQGNLRCVRVGAIHAADYGAVKAIVARP